MSGARMRRVDEAMRQVLGDALAQELKDPRIGFVTVTDVKTSPDLGHARVYVSVLGTDAEQEATLDGLRSAHGFLQGRVASELRLKRTPELTFELDFSAEQAARLADLQGWRVIGVGESAGFLRHLAVEGLEDAELVGLLRRLGLRTLGDLAALPARDVLTRFGAYGAKVHRLARGVDPVEPATRTPPPDLVREVAFEPPLASVEAVCFSVRRTAEDFVAALGDRGLVCTAVRVEAEGDDARRSLLSGRTWMHSRWFSVADLVDRVHWQLQASPAGVTVGAPVGLVRFLPETVEQSAAHADGLWGGDNDDRVDRGVARVQAMLGYDAVVVPVRQGGRSPSDRQALVPWGERPTGLRPPELPWPGQLPPPAPTRVFAEPWATSVVGPAGQPVAVTERGAVTCEPTRFAVSSSGGTVPGWQPVDAWAGPWPVDERWWEPDAPALPVARFQVVGVDGSAWLMVVENGRWFTEARYD